MSGSARWAAVVGNPARHSLSPRIFRAFSSALGRNLRYRAISLRPASLEPAIKEAARGSWIGWNVTVPYKLEVMRYLDEFDPSVREVGAVNVIRFRGGRGIGYNTDCAGFLAPLARRGFSLMDKRVAVLGAGGAARAACAALKREKAAELLILNRTLSKAHALAEALGARAEKWNEETIVQAAEWADLLVNATSLGLDGKSSPLPEGAALRPGALAYDLNYVSARDEEDAPLRTPFLRAAERGGAQVLGGLGMLVAQAGETWRIWFGEKVPEALLERVELDLARGK